MTEMPQHAGDLRTWLRSLKDEAGVSYAEIARGIGEEERNVKRWMTVSGKPTIPAGDTLLRLLDYFGVTLTPPAPRQLVSLMGEIRDVRETVHRLESGGGGDRAVSLPEIDRRLEALVASVAHAIELLNREEPGGGEQKRGRAGQ